ncbi:hypothetical protein [Dyadobacter sp. 3J3]|uniref:hypothetical protein n=1 Tax=Dyadobacter sp. 3J3 TaxID=2606600 RepID=UPI00135AD634|nr:hypothetical protein [Dyadobacter sp. 3J3]
MNDSEIVVLAENGSYNGDRMDGHLEETHISWVLFTHDYAFKIKKPVKLSFLDFSRLGQRKKFCEKELLLNQRFSQIYLDVIPVREKDGDWKLGVGKGRVVDYAVRMKKMKSAKRMDKLLQKGNVETSHMLALARQVSSFHQKAKIVKKPFDLTEVSDTFDDLKSIHPVVLKELGMEFAEIIDLAVSFSKAFLLLHIKRFRERIRLGFQRDVHGDLHSGNVFLYREPVIFDCIEFNDRYRQIDVLNEIAFLCMDLEFYGQFSLSEIFVNQYVDLLPCFQTAGDNALFIYYKLARANVRAKVHALRVMESGEKGELEFTRKYLLLMKEYMRQIIL